MRRVFVLVPFLVLATACSGGGGDESAGSVSSPDGALTLTVPDGSDVEATITAIDPPEIPGSSTVLGAYELGPDGATFSSPARIEFRSELALDGDAIPIVGLFVDHGDGFEPLADQASAVVDGVVVATGSIDGFSSVIALSPGYGRSGAGVRLSPASFTAMLDESVSVTAELIDTGCQECFVRLPEVVPDSLDREVAILGARIREAVAGASVWDVTCLREGTATYTARVSYELPDPWEETGTWTGVVVAEGRATCLSIFEAATTTTATTLPLRVAFDPTCTEASRICPEIELDLEDPEFITIRVPDLSAPADLIQLRLAAGDGGPEVECRAFGDVRNCGLVNPDQSVSDTFDIEITPAPMMEMRIPAEALLELFEQVPFHPVSLYLTTGDGSGEAFFTEEEQRTFRDALVRGG